MKFNKIPKICSSVINLCYFATPEQKLPFIKKIPIFFLSTEKKRCGSFVLYIFSWFEKFWLSISLRQLIMKRGKFFFSAFITKKSISLFTSCKTLAKPLTSNKINCLVTCAFKMKSNWKSSWINQLTEWLQRAEKDLGYSFVGDSRLSKHHPVEGN